MTWEFLVEKNLSKILLGKTLFSSFQHGGLTDGQPRVGIVRKSPCLLHLLFPCDFKSSGTEIFYEGFPYFVTCWTQPGCDWLCPASVLYLLSQVGQKCRRHSCYLES